MTAPTIATATCSRCPHPLADHGAGCTSGWFAPGPECHCPNDSGGENVQTCARERCKAASGAVTHVDAFGQFFCPDHKRGTAIDEITSWVQGGERA